MRYILNITPEELLKKEFYEDYGDEIFKFKKAKGIFDSVVYLLTYNEEFEFLFDATIDGWELNFKTMWLGTNSDNFFIGGVAIKFLGQMLEQKVIRFESEIEQ